MPISPEEAIRFTKQFISSENKLPQKERDEMAFFKELLKVRKINNIYYPGNGFDFSLDNLFKPHQITYLDREPRGKNVEKGDFRSTPGIPTGFFDAAFLQDIHQDRIGLSEIVRTIKENGLVIVGLHECGEESKDAMTPDQVAQYPLLSEEFLVQGHPGFRTFLKVEK